MECLAALITLFDMPAQRGRPADLNGAHQTELLQRQTVLLAVGLAVLSKYVGQFERWPRHLIGATAALAGRFSRLPASTHRAG